MTNAIVLFDGVCTLCAWSVQFVLKRDPKGYFRFAALQSPIGQQLLSDHGLSEMPNSSVVLIENETAYTRSGAALRIARHLNGAWPLLSVFLIVPRFLRDGIYGWIASNRYRWFGKKESCMVMTRDIRDRFLDIEKKS